MTILEMVIAMSIMAMVFSVIAPLIRNIQNSWASKQASAETLQNARVLVEHINRNLAKATRITSVSSPSENLGFIEFIDNLGNTMRYEVGDNDYVRFGQVDDLSDLAGPVSKLQFSGYSLDDMDDTTTDVETIRFVRAESTFVNEESLGTDKSLAAQAYIQANGNIAEETMSFSAGISAKESIEYGGYSAIFDSYNSSQGYNPATAGSNAVATVNSKKSSRFMLYTHATLNGDAYIGPGGNINTVIQLYNGSQITGSQNVLEESVNIPNISAPNPSTLGKNKGNISMWGSMVQTIDEDGYYNNIGLWGNSTLKISGNITILVKNSVEVDSNADLEIMPGSSLKLYVKKDCNIGGKLNANTEDPSKLHIYMSGNKKSFEMYGHAEVHALLENPKGSVSIWNQRPFFGRIRCKELQGNGPIHIDMNSDFPDNDGGFGGGTAEILP